MNADVDDKLRTAAHRNATAATQNESLDKNYWITVCSQLLVHLSKIELFDIHSHLLVCHLEKLEKKKEELSRATTDPADPADKTPSANLR